MPAAAFLSLCLYASPEIGVLPPLEIVRGWPSWERIVEARKAASDNYAERLTPVAWDSLSVWGLVWRAGNKTFAESYRREALQELVELVGWRAVLTGTFPHPIPWE